MEPKIIDIRKVAACLVSLLCGIALFYLFFRYLFGILFPFLFGWLLASLARPLARKIRKISRIPERLLRLLFTLTVFTLSGAFFWVCGARLLSELQRLLASLTSEGGSNPLARVAERFPVLFGGDAGERLEYLLSMIRDTLTGTLPSVIGYLISFLPRFIFALAVTLVSAIYFSLDLETVNRGLLSLLPAAWRRRVLSLKGGIARIGIGYVRAYLLLGAITFALVFTGLLLIRTDYAILLALLISLVDLLPVLGVGTVLVPWSAWCFLAGDPARGIGLLVLWGVVLLVRQYAEPKVIGGTFGIHPLLTLFAMYAGFSLAGVAGMLLAPPLALLLFAALPGDRGPEPSAGE